jgi:hypothetical protein
MEWTKGNGGYRIEVDTPEKWLKAGAKGRVSLNFYDKSRNSGVPVDIKKLNPMVMPYKGM